MLGLPASWTGASSTVCYFTLVRPPPKWGGTLCGDHQACTSCKIRLDDVTTNPLLRRSTVLAALPTGLRHFDRLAQAHSLLHPTMVETTQAVLATPGSLPLPRALSELIKDWGYLILLGREAQELLEVYHVPIEHIVFRTVMVSISGRIALRYQILYDPGEPRLRWLPTSACALGCLSRITQPSRAKTVADLVELLMGVFCLSFFYPTSLTYGQAYMAALGADITKIILASIRTAPVVPFIQWGFLPLDPGEAGLIYSPRRGPVPSPVSAALPLGVGALTVSRTSPSGERPPSAPDSAS